MRITDVVVGNKVQIILDIDEKRLVFDSVIMGIVDGTVLISPLTENDKTLGFSKHTVTVVTVNSDNKPFMWNDITLKLVKYNNQTYHQLLSESDGSYVNRRKFYRQYVGLPGIVNVFNKSYEVIVKDVSAKGISFVTTEELELGSNVTVSFQDDNKSFVMRCKIVRTLKTADTDKIVYGCECLEPNRKIEQYISIKQRLDIQKKLSSNADKNN